MLRHCLLGFWVALSCAAEQMPTGYFRGTMVRWQGTLTSGILSARAANGTGVFDCAYDAKSYLEFEKRRVKVDKYLEGDPLELLVHRRPGESTCYILSAEFVPPPPKPLRPVKPAPPKPVRTPVRHGTQTISGAVVSLTENEVIVRSRSGERTAFRLRRDTRYIGNGLRLDRSDLPLNQHVAVESGRNEEGELDAFQLTWGDLSVH